MQRIQVFNLMESLDQQYFWFDSISILDQVTPESEIIKIRFQLDWEEKTKLFDESTLGLSLTWKTLLEKNQDDINS